MSGSGLIERVAHFVREERLIAPHELVVVGLSGGVDSIALLHVLVRLDIDVVAAHVNYGLRGEESEEDERLARSTCAMLGVPLETARYDTKRVAEERDQSVQEAARDLRYAFFGEVAHHGGATTVAVGHHADDQAETVLLNLFRGTGIAGLAGMPPARPLSEGTGVLLVRPLLLERRAVIELHAREHGLVWREDSSNLASRYRRGALRGQIMPIILEHFGDAVPERIARSAGLVQAYLIETLDPELALRFASCSTTLEDGGELFVDELQAQSPALRGRLILEAVRRWMPGTPRTLAAAAAVDALLDAQVGRRALLEEGEVWRERTTLRFRRQRAAAEGWEMSIPVREGVFALPDGSLEIKKEPLPADFSRDTPYSVVVDARALGTELALRTWQDGDRIRPFGMSAHKKVSDLLTNRKVPSFRRRDVPVAVAGEEIVWVLGVRLGESVRVTADTTDALRLTYLPDRDT